MQTLARVFALAGAAAGTGGLFIANIATALLLQPQSQHRAWLEFALDSWPKPWFLLAALEPRQQRCVVLRALALACCGWRGSASPQ